MVGRSSFHVEKKVAKESKVEYYNQRTVHIYIYIFTNSKMVKKENFRKFEIYPSENSNVHFSTPVIINLSKQAIRRTGQPKKAASGICNEKTHKNICEKQ